MQLYKQSFAKLIYEKLHASHLTLICLRIEKKTPSTKNKWGKNGPSIKTRARVHLLGKNVIQISISELPLSTQRANILYVSSLRGETKF